MRSCTASVPLIHVDVFPLPQTVGEAAHAEPSFLAASIKLHLFQTSVLKSVESSENILEWTCEELTRNSSLFLQGSLSCSSSKVELDANEGREPLDKHVTAVLMLPQNTIILPSLWPCQCRGYITQQDCKDAVATTITPQSTACQVHVTETTTIHVYPPTTWSSLHATHGWMGLVPPLPPSLQEEVRTNHNPETIQELFWHLKQMWHREILIGNTPHALKRHWMQQERRRKFATMFQRDTATTMKSQSQEESFLLVHSPDHGAGKSLLVQCLVRQLESSSRVHVIRCANLLAQYGVAADVALTCDLHQIVYAAALRQVPVCIVLDDLQAILSPNTTTTSTTGDAALPVLHAMTVYLRILARQLSQGTFPFPTNNPLYNLCDDDNSSGQVFSVRLALVATVTCPDGKPTTTNSQASKSVLDALGTATVKKYRLPALSASTRLTAFRDALRRAGVNLSDQASIALPRLAASAVGARGAIFEQIAHNVPTSGCTAEDLGLATLRVLGRTATTKTNVSFEASHDDATSELFASVGGNSEAKLALREALALDPQRRELLSSFGLTPPSGIMLYGPPGTGKTLLARAVAKVLQNQSSSAVGGAFVSLSSSDIVHAEVGMGENLLVSAFETARMNAPAVVFIDEFQALFTDRSSGGSSRFSSTLLSLLDDIRRWDIADQHVAGDSVASVAAQRGTSQRVVVLAATNTPWMVDKAFLRPGRFDQVVHVGLPHFLDRQNIFELLIGKMKTTFCTPEDVHKFSLTLAEATEGYSGADISVVCRTAAVECLVASEEVVNEQHFRSAIGQVKASSSQALVDSIFKWKL